ncbi:MAG: hypothetical protein ACWA5A_09405 [Marinibacterium sp.]
MTTDEQELIRKLAMSLVACMELVEREVEREKRENAGKRIRQITWQKRRDAFGKLIAAAADVVLIDQ